jgi:dTDP-4-dehydrorhamnose 3,5-epimerase
LFCEEQFAAVGLESHFPQTSLSFNSRAGTVRGLHFQPVPHSETKLVRCTRGQIFDVVVDLRRDEPTFLQWCGFELSADNGNALYIPAGFAHGFQTIVDESDVLYAITPPFSPGREAGVRWNDPAIQVRWPLPISVISDRDQAWPAIATQTS